MESFDTVKMKKREGRLGKVSKTSRGSGFKAAVLTEAAPVQEHSHTGGRS